VEFRYPSGFIYLYRKHQYNFTNANLSQSIINKYSYIYKTSVKVHKGKCTNRRNLARENINTERGNATRKNHLPGKVKFHAVNNGTHGEVFIFW